MPDLYDRSDRATELRLKFAIIERVQSGRRPAKYLEVPLPGMDGRRSEAGRQKIGSESDDSEEEVASGTSLPESLAELYDFA